MDKTNNIIVIGGGASGMMAAISAFLHGGNAVVAERLDRVGKKLLATGNGRCNLTNSVISVSRYHGEDTSFFESIYKQFDLNKTIDFFEHIGITVKEEEDGKMFPLSGQASSVLDQLRYEMKKLGIQELCNFDVRSIKKNNNKFYIYFNNGDVKTFDKVVLCTGGRANPNLGSNGSGYKLAMSFGHRIIEPFPAIVQIKLNAPYLKAVKGVKFIGKASIVSNNKILRCESGEILFTDYGISGPPILQLSRIAGEAEIMHKRTSIVLDMFPDIDEDSLFNMLKTRIGYDLMKPLAFSFVGFLNKRLIPVVLKAAGISDINKECKNIKDDELHNIVKILKEWNIEITGTQSYSDAQVTAGGIDVSDVNYMTLESKLAVGLYFAGEVLDIDGDCGGFNLQWAWSSGYIAGMNAAK